MRRRLFPVVLLASLPLALGGAGPAGAMSYADQVISDGAIHYWRFEETSTLDPAADEIPTAGGQNNNPGSYEGGMILGVASAAPGLGTAAEFDGAAGTHVSLGTPQHPGDSFSIEAWVLLDSGAGGAFYPIAGRWDGSWQLAMTLGPTGADIVTLSIRNEIDTLAEATIPDLSRDVWHHVVGTFVGESDGGGGTATIYLDGARGATASIGFDLRDAGGDDGLWYIGRTGDPAQVSWGGRIDEVAIYPRALSAAEISNHIALALELSYPDAVVADGAIHYWRFEESSPATPAADEIPSGGGQLNNPGSYEGGVTLGIESAEPALGSAVRFDGQNGTQISLGTAQHPGASMSVEAWLRLAADAAGSFISAGGRWDGSWELDVDAGTPDRANLAVRNEFNTFAASETDTFHREFWHHVVGVFDGASDGGSGSATIYLDGIQGSIVTIGFDLQDVGGDDGEWYIGTTRSPLTGLPWNGAIDEFAIYPHALTTAEVRTHLALARVPVPEPSGELGLGAGLVLLGLLGRYRPLRRSPVVPK